MKNTSFIKPLTLVLISILVIIALSCSEKPHDTPTQGSLVMITSEDIFPVIDIQVKEFMRVYEKTKIRNISSSTRNAIVQMLNDSVKVIVVPRNLNDEEKNVVEKNSLDVSSTKIAYDGVAVIANVRSGITQITVQALHDILTGRITRWTALHHAALTSRIVVGMCGINSGTYEYIKQRIVPDTAFAPVIERCSTSPDVISFVSEHPNAIGFVPVSWLKHYTDTVTVLEVGDPNFKSDSTSTEMEYFSPEQAYMYKGYYPLTRPVYLFVHNADGGVETGFASFAAGVEGQRIIVKNGLVPATMPVRLVHLNNQ